MGKQYFPSLIYSFNKTLYMAFVHLEKAFHHVPWHVIWWALRKLGIEEWLVLLIQSLYENARSGFWLQPEWSVKCESGCSPGFCLNPPTVSSQAWKPSPRSFIQDFPGKTCMKMTWTGLHELQRSGKDICAVYHKGIGINSISCGGCLVGFTRNAVVSQVQV